MSESKITIKKGDIILIDGYREAEVIRIIDARDTSMASVSGQYLKVKYGRWGRTMWISHYSVKGLIEARS